jgi:hypothetical protein
MARLITALRSVAVFLLLLQLGGCGIVSLGYNYADVYLRYTINSYTTFSKEQKQEIHRDVDAFMHWHRKMMLPEYVAFLRDLQHKVESDAPLSAEEVRSYRLRVRKLYVSTLQPTIVPAAQLLNGMTVAQAEEMSASLDRENAKQREKDLAGSREEQIRLRTERTIDFIENLVGSLSDKQLEQLRAANASLPFASDIYQRLKEDNQKHLVELIRKHEGRDDIENFLSLWLIMPEKFRKAEEQDTLQAFEQGSDELIAQVYAMLTERQKGKLLKSITRYADSFDELSKE